jgi:hypothetical protein
VKLEVYEHLLLMNAGFDQAIRSLAALRKHSGFHGGMLARFTALSKEARAEAKPARPRKRAGDSGNERRKKDWTSRVTETRGWKNDVARGVPIASLPGEQGIKKGTLAIPPRLARDSSQANFRDRAGLAHGQEQ